MIGYLRGEIASVDDNALLIDVNGVGYRVSVPTSVRASVQAGDTDVKIHTSMVVSEGDISLYGFLTVEERDIFETLITVSGIGPKVGVRLLSIQHDQLVEAIQACDIGVLTTVQGIGKKIAERVCLELKDKIAGMPRGATGLSPALMQAKGEIGIAMHGLQTLGFSPSEIRAMLKLHKEEEYKGLTAQQIITMCLKTRK